MRILFVGNGGYKSRGASYYFDGRKLRNGFVRNSHDVYMLSDRDTSREGNIFRSSELGVGYCNKVFLDVCRNFKPEMIVFFAADIIRNESLAKARSLLPGVRMAQLNIDPLFSQNNIDKLRRKMPYMDATFITTAGSILGTLGESAGVVSYMPNAIDSSIETVKCHERSDQKNDVFWACRLPLKKELCIGNPRFEIPLFLEDSGKVAIDYYGMNNRRPLFGVEYYENIANAKMGLNINQGTFLQDFVETPGHECAYLYASDRISHYMGSGLLVFSHRDSERDPKLEDLFEEDKELVFFSSQEELLDKVLYYKKNDEQRREIARRGWEKSHYRLNGTLLAKYIVEVTFNLPLSEDYAWPTELH